jgi:ABC-type multidrug transport system fused ATPase/permease subunit
MTLVDIIVTVTIVITIIIIIIIIVIIIIIIIFITISNSFPINIFTNSSRERVVLQEKLDIQFQKIAASKLAAAEALNKKLEFKNRKIPSSPSSEKKMDSEKGEIRNILYCVTSYI